MSSIHSVGITANRGISGVETAVRKAIAVIEPTGCEILMDGELDDWLGLGYGAGELSQFAPRCQLILVFGGDGTFLRAARSLDSLQVPLLGINAGGLGFLTVLRRTEFEPTLRRILAGEYQIENRMRLKATLIRAGETLGEHTALNDAVMRMGHSNRLVEFSIAVGGQYLGGYRADGLIVATPTGSTAYSMSAGGPIVHPTMDALVATPICPHALAIRPLVAGAGEQFEIRIGGRSGEAALHVDGTMKVWLMRDDIIRISQAEGRLPMLLPRDFSYYALVRDKLGWGGVPAKD